MKHQFHRSIAVVAALVCSSTQVAHAAVSVDEAQKLKTTLTPLGAERAGNATGTIPAWTGGYTTVAPGYKTGDLRPDPFGSDKVVSTITAKDADKQGDKLSDGTKALLKKYPDSFRLEIYPTRRSAALPQWVYDNTFRNATSAKTKNGGIAIEGAYGGTPFPIPMDGAEAMWNHRLTFSGTTSTLSFANYTGTADGKQVLVSKGANHFYWPYYDPATPWNANFTGAYVQVRVATTDPAFKSGESLLFIDSLDRPRQAWQYFPGQRRVRKSPTVCCDTPNDINSGQEYFDEGFMWSGDLDRYNWKLVGKQEMYIPYNNNRWIGLPTEKRYASHHVEPSSIRWELHRVWIVEATLAEGKRHVIPKRRFYLDEDTWAAVLSEGWDADGKLWRFGMGVPSVVSEGPFVHGNFPWFNHNLQTGTWVNGGAADPEKKAIFKQLPKLPATFFTPDALSGEGVR